MVFANCVGSVLAYGRLAYGRLAYGRLAYSRLAYGRLAYSRLAYRFFLSISRNIHSAGHICFWGVLFSGVLFSGVLKEGLKEALKFMNQTPNRRAHLSIPHSFLVFDPLLKKMELKIACFYTKFLQLF